MKKTTLLILFTFVLLSVFGQRRNVVIGDSAVFYGGIGLPDTSRIWAVDTATDDYDAMPKFQIMDSINEAGTKWTDGSGTNAIYQNGIDAGTTTDKDNVVTIGWLGMTKFLNWSLPIVTPVVDYGVLYSSADSMTYPIKLKRSNVTELRADTVIYDRIYLSGYYTDNDMPGSEYLWDASSTLADNGGTVIKLTGTTTGRYIMTPQPNGYYLEQFGGVASVSSSYDRTNASALQVMVDSNYIIRLGRDSKYRFDESIDAIGKQLTIHGEASGKLNTEIETTSILLYTGHDDSAAIKIGGTEASYYDSLNADYIYDIDLRNFMLEGTSSSKIGIDARSMIYSNFKNVYLYKFDTPLSIMHSFGNSFDDLKIHAFTDYGIKFMGEPSNSNVFTNLSITTSRDGLASMYFETAHSIVFDGLLIDGARECDFYVIVNNEFESISINGHHIEDAGNVITIDKSGGEMQGSISFDGGIISVDTTYEAQAGGNVYSKFINYEGYGEYGLKKLNIENTVLRLSPTYLPGYSEDFLNLSGVLQADIDEGFFFITRDRDNSYTYPSFTHMGDSINPNLNDFKYYNLPKVDGVYRNNLPHKVPVEYWGIGTGKSDNVANFQKMLDYGVTDVVFSKGTYTFLDKVTVPADVTLHFESGSIYSSSDTLVINETQIEAGNVQIFSSDLVITGTAKLDYWNESWFADFDNALSQIAEPYKLYVGENTVTSYVVIVDKDIEITGNKSTVTIGSGYAIYFENNINVSNVNFTGSAGFRLNQTTAEDSINIIFDNCIFTNQADAVGTYTTDASYAGITNFKVTNCVFDNVVDGVKVDVVLIGEGLIQGNKFKNNLIVDADTRSANIIVGNAGNDLKVSGILIDNNEFYDQVNTYAADGIGGKAIWCYATSVTISDNYFHDTESSNTNYGFRAIYIQGHDNIIKNNRFINFQKGLLNASVTFKGHYRGKFQTLSNNTFINDDISPNIGYIVIGDGTVKMYNNYIETYADSLSDTQDIVFAFQEVDEDISNMGEITGNWIVTDRTALGFGGRRTGIDKKSSFIVKDNHFISKHSLYIDDATMIYCYADTVGMIDITGNEFRLEYGRNALTSTGINVETINFTNNDIVSIYETAAYSIKTHVFRIGGLPTNLNIKENKFKIRGIGYLGSLIAASVLIEDNKFEFDFQFTSTTVVNGIISQSATTGCDNWDFIRNDISFSDSTTNGGAIYLFKQSSAKERVNYENNVITNPSSQTIYGLVASGGNTTKFRSYYNTYDGIDRVYYNIPYGGDAILEGDIVTNSDIYVYNNKHIENLSLRDLDITTTSHAFQFYAGFSVTDLFIGANVSLTAGGNDFWLYNGTATNMYGINKGQNFDIGYVGSGAITNIWGVNQVDTDVTNLLQDTEVAGDLISQSITDDGTDVEISEKLVLTDNISQSSQTVTGATTIVYTNVYCTSAATGAFDLTLPAYASTTGDVYYIQNYSGFTVTLKPAAGEVLNGTTDGSKAIADGSAVRIHNSGISGIAWSTTAVAAR